MKSHRRLRTSSGGLAFGRMRLSGVFFWGSLIPVYKKCSFGKRPA